ncbi:MAG: hypothetical protein ACPKPY_03225 [Nitrososphaeraceae archaeon]
MDGRGDPYSIDGTNNLIVYSNDNDYGFLNTAVDSNKNNATFTYVMFEGNEKEILKWNYN